MEQFSVITMIGKNGKELFFGANEKGYGYKWNTNSNNAIWFDTEKQAMDFAGRYFKGFQDWEVKPLNYDIELNTIEV